MKPFEIPMELTSSIQREDKELGTGILSTLNVTFDEMILTFAVKSQWLPDMCTWKCLGIFNGIGTHDHDHFFHLSLNHSS